MGQSLHPLCRPEDVASAVLFVWPEIPHAPAEWDYTGPLLGIVVAALAVGEAITWRMAHPRAPLRQEQQPAGEPQRELEPQAQSAPSAAQGHNA